MPDPLLQGTPPTPKDSPLPRAPSRDPLSEGQWRTLWAFADTIIASIPHPKQAKSATDVVLNEAEYNEALKKIEHYALADGNAELAADYLAERASDNLVFRDNIHRLLCLNVPKDMFDQLTLGLTLLNYRIGSLILTSSPTIFADQPLRVRQDIIQAWATARIPTIRLLFKSLNLLIKQTWSRSSVLFQRTLAFPRVPVHGTPGPGFDFSFIEIPPGAEPEIIETDVVVVGSGCGGGVIASNLSAAGQRVLVVDKSYHWPASHLPMSETEGWTHLFHNGGYLLSEDSSTCVLAGQAWGGGGTINWSASLQTQGYVRDEWAKAGLPFFTSAEYQHCLDTVCDKMGVSADHIKHNKNNSVLLEGARRLGMTAKPVPQNTGGQQHYCGYCTMGCGACEKQGPAVSYLPAAASNGAKFIEGFDVQKVLFRKDKRSGRKTAIGVEGLWASRDQYLGSSDNRISRKVIIKAKRVVISAGTMHTPMILMRSGLKNRHIGKNLKLHPVCVVGGIFEEEVRPWEGGILTAVVSSLENLDGKGHGTKLEACTMLPSTWLAFPQWRGGLDWKLLAPRFKNMSGHISLARDISSGSIYIDPNDGRCRYRYNPNKTDRRHILEGMIALAKINYISGAKEIFTALPAVPNFVREAKVGPDKADYDASGINDPKFNAWLDKIRSVGLVDPDTTFMSAHQMGSCRMGATPKSGAIDPNGRVWEADGLYVADASTFPSASGVNPMVTNMAISEWIARGIIKDLNVEGKTRTRL